MNDKQFRLFLAGVIVVLLGFIGWAMLDHYYHDHGIRFHGPHFDVELHDQR